MIGIFGIVSILGRNNNKVNFIVICRMLVYQIKFKGLILFTVLL